MRNTEKILLMLDKMKLKPQSYAIKVTTYKYSKYIFKVSLFSPIIIAIFALFHFFIYSLPHSIIYFVNTFFLVFFITLILSATYIIYKNFREFLKDDQKWDNSTNLILQKEEYAAELENNFNANELFYVKELLEDLKARYKERIQLWGIGFSISVILGGLSIIDKIFGDFSLFISNFNNLNFTSQLIIYSFALFLGMGLGTLALKIRIQHLNYKISLIDLTKLRRGLIDKS